MRLLIILFFLLKSTYAFSTEKVVYLDVQFIIDNSKLGVFYKDKLLKFKNENKSKLIKQRKKIKNEENEINKQKNILKKEEIDNKIKKLNLLLNKYQKDLKENNQNLSGEQKKYTKIILKNLNPIVTKYVKDNNILIVLDKKNILVGSKTLDITENILNELNKFTIDKDLLSEN
tara:strand:+ start:3711 stop:4232 length:522 start_codon:yes stop_codon:yes gene_type:complete